MPDLSRDRTRLLRAVRGAGLLLALLLLVAACGGYAQTTRRVNGQLLTGRPIQPQAYALYFEAAAAEARGELRRARDLYLSAEEVDPDSPELWTRIGALSCKLKLAMADAEIQAALELDGWYAPAWRERARCELSRGKLEHALRFARQAQIADPGDFENTALLAQIHTKRRALGAARAQLLGYIFNHPHSARGWRELYIFASHNGPKHWAWVAADELQARRAHPSPLRSPARPIPCHRDSLEQDCGSSLAQEPEAELVDARLVDALLADDLPATQRSATALGVSQQSVVRTALRHAKPALAVRQAELLIAASPHDSHARVWGLLAAHRAGDDSAFRRWLKLPEEMTSLDAAAVQVLEMLIHERLGANITPHLAEQSDPIP